MMAAATPFTPLVEPVFATLIKGLQEPGVPASSDKRS